MTVLSRRGLVLGASALSALAACGNGVGSNAGAALDARADSSINFLESNYPDTVVLREKAAGYLVIPVITEAGLGFGGAYGEGVLRIGGATVDYYSAANASVGLQIGAQQYSHALFFMTPDALTTFRTSDGWAVGANMTYALDQDGGTLNADTNTLTSSIIALVYGQRGIIGGATLEGTKYTRIIR